MNFIIIRIIIKLLSCGLGKEPEGGDFDYDESISLIKLLPKVRSNGSNITIRVGLNASDLLRITIRLILLTKTTTTQQMTTMIMLLTVIKTILDLVF